MKSARFFEPEVSLQCSEESDLDELKKSKATDEFFMSLLPSVRL
jgi:hypothetical protein